MAGNTPPNPLFGYSKWMTNHSNETTWVQKDFFFIIVLLFFIILYVVFIPNHYTVKQVKMKKL